MFLGVCCVGQCWWVLGILLLAAAIGFVALVGAERVWKYCGIDCGIALVCGVDKQPGHHCCVHGRTRRATVSQTLELRLCTRRAFFFKLPKRLLSSLHRSPAGRCRFARALHRDLRCFSLQAIHRWRCACHRHFRCSVAVGETVSGRA